MKSSQIFFVMISLIFLVEQSHAKVGRISFSRGARSGGGRGGGMKIGGGAKSSGGSFSLSVGGLKASYSAPKPSYQAPSIFNNAQPFAWNVNGGSGSSNTPMNPQSFGWNIGSKTGSSGWNFNSKNAPKAPAAAGPPPAYPGLQNKPVLGNNAPPAYSPAMKNPPSYNQANKPGSYNSPGSYNNPGSSKSKNSNNFGTANSFPGQNQLNGYASGYSPNQQKYYGNTFGSRGLAGNTYIANNYYGQRGSFGGRISGYLINSLFYGVAFQNGYLLGSNNYHNRRSWNDEDDRKWRATTQAPYFENKVPGEDKILPASAVIGAATAFGLVSLLPLNVPSNKPLMYCSNGTDLMQSQIRINNENVYQCINNTIEISCLKISENETSTEHHCSNKTMQCDLKDDEIIGSIYCQNGTLLSNNFLFCNSTTLLNGTNVNETSIILNCYEGKLPESQAAFIPTTTTTQAPTTTTAKSLSFGAKAHIFFLKLIGKGDVLMTTTTPAPEIPQIQAQDTWIPEALTIPPETTTLNEPTNQAVNLISDPTETSSIYSESPYSAGPEN